MCEIEKNVKMPSSRYDRGYMYPFREMEIGDSFFTVRGVGARNSARYYGNKHGVKFTTRTEEDKHGNRGLRVWRIK